MSLSVSAPSSSILLHACFVLLLLLAAMVSTTATASAVSVEHRDVKNMTAFITSGGSSSSAATTSPPDAAAAENFEMYYCFLCTERHPLLIHYCPIYWDECHLNCWDWDATTSTAIPGAPPAPPVQGKQCYVMKLYMSGRYVIVERLSCDGIASCFLTCGGGELDDRKVAMGTTAATTATTAAIQGRFFVPFELCNTQHQVNAPPSSGAIVPAAGGGGGARRRS